MFQPSLGEILRSMLNKQLLEADPRRFIRGRPQIMSTK